MILLIFLYFWSAWFLCFRFYKFKTDHDFHQTYGTLIYGLRDGGSWVAAYQTVEFTRQLGYVVFSVVLCQYPEVKIYGLIAIQFLVRFFVILLDALLPWNCLPFLKEETAAGYHFQ